MRKTLFLLTMIFAFACGSAQVKAPDFAYPKTVAKNAESAYKAAVKSGNDASMLKYAIQLYLSEISIDYSSSQKAIANFDKRTNKLKKESAKALANLFKATAYRYAYNENQYQYNQRELPLTPRPAKIEEWSREMYKVVIDSLANDAYRLSGNTALSEYASLIDSDDLSLRFFPTVRDFVASLSLNSILMQPAPENRKKIIEEMIAFHSPHSNPWYTWSTMLIDTKPYEEKTQALMALYKSQPAETGRAYTLNKLIPQLYDIYKKPTERIAFLDSAAADFKAYWIEPQIKYQLDILRNPNFEMSTAQTKYAADSESVKLKIGYRNLRSANIKVYNFKDEKAAEAARKAGYGAFKPVQSINLSFPNFSANEADTTICIKLPAGCNAITADIPASTHKQGPMLLTAYRMVPVLVSSNVNKQTLYVVDAVSGKPMKNVIARAVKNGKLLKNLGTTDEMGRISFTETNGGHLELRYNGYSCFYPDFYFYNSRYSRDNEAKIDISTNLGIYRPGDTVEFVGCLADTLGARSKAKLEFELEDSEYNTIADTIAVTDEFGRFVGSFKLPKDCRTGRFSISADWDFQGNHANSNVGFEVSDFKMPAFRGDSIYVVGMGVNNLGIIAKGRIVDYSDFPVADAKVSVRVDVNDSTYTTTTDYAGRFEIKIDSVFTKLPTFEARQVPFINNDYRRQFVTISATSAEGATLELFESGISPYPNTIYANNIPSKADTNEDILVDVRIKNYWGKDVPSTILWQLKANGNDSIIQRGNFPSGEARLNLKDVKPGEYKLQFAPADSSACMQYSAITLYSLTSDILPVKDKVFWLPSDSATIVNGEAHIRALVAATGANIFYGLESDPENLKLKHFASGWQEIVMPLKDYSETDKLILFAIYELDKTSYNLSLPKAPKAEAFKLTIESFRDKVNCGDIEHWRLRTTGPDGKGISSALVLNVYNSRLDFFQSPERLTPGRPIPFHPNVNYKFMSTGWSAYYYLNGIVKQADFSSPIYPMWNTYNAPVSFDYARLMNRGGVRSTAIYGARAPKMYANDLAGATSGIATKFEEETEKEAMLNEVVTLAYATTAAPASGAKPVLKEDQWRAPDLFTALWQPSLTTDADGNTDITFAVPNATTSWSFTATAWDKQMNTASLQRTITASKPVMVSANLPRFLRAGDSAIIIASAMNNSDKALPITITTEVSLRGSDSILVSTSNEFTIAAKAKELVSTNIAVADSLQGKELIFRVRATSGDFTDGVQTAIPVLDAESFVREAINFYLNPSDSTYTTELPAPRGRDFRSEFSFTANPMATIIDALPTLWKDPAPTAIHQTSAYYGAAIALALAREYPEVAAKFDSKKLEQLAGECLERLAKLQRADGGWAWGEWSSQSSEWVTSLVLDRFYDLIRWKYLPDDKNLHKMLAKAVKYYDSRMRGEYDMLYTIIRPEYNIFSRPSVNGQNTIDRTLNDITRSWKKYSTDAKALSVIALANNKRLATARSIIASLDEYAVQSPTKGTQFRNEKSLLAYGHLLEAYAAAAPKSETVDGLRQYLIVRRQACDWGNWNQTTYVVSSFLNSGTRWNKPTTTPSLFVDGRQVALTEPSGASMVYSANVSGGKLKLDVTGANVPSYGAIVSSYIAPMSEIKAYSEDDEIYISKRLLVKGDDNKWRDAPAELKVGMTVRVSITLRAGRPMSYVNITDERPAAFEPVEQLSQTVWQDALLYYRENRNSATRLYIDYLPEGTNVISYDVTVNNAGTFSAGIATATCDKAPSLTAHSAGATLRVLPANK